jgi:hypothetical protein
MSNDLDADERSPAAVNLDELKQRLELVKVSGMSLLYSPNIHPANHLNM